MPYFLPIFYLFPEQQKLPTLPAPLSAASCYFPEKRVRRLLVANSQTQAARKNCPLGVLAAGWLSAESYKSWFDKSQLELSTLLFSFLLLFFFSFSICALKLLYTPHGSPWARGPLFCLVRHPQKSPLQTVTLQGWGGWGRRRWGEAGEEGLGWRSSPMPGGPWATLSEDGAAESAGSDCLFVATAGGRVGYACTLELECIDSKPPEMKWVTSSLRQAWNPNLNLSQGSQMFPEASSQEFPSPRWGVELRALWISGGWARERGAAGILHTMCFKFRCLGAVVCVCNASVMKNKHPAEAGLE